MSEKLIFAGAAKTIRTPEQDFRTRFSWSSGWTNMPFATNVNISAPRRGREIDISIIVNEAHIGFRSALQNAKQLSTRGSVVQKVEHIRHALLDHPSVPEGVHCAVIGNMGKLTLAHMIRVTDVFHPDIIPKFLPVAQEYDAITVQQFEEEHNLVRHEASVKLSVA